jgi:exosortase A
MRRGILLTVLVLVLGCVALWPSLGSLVGYWDDTANLTYTHGFLIAAVSACLVWRSRGALGSMPLKPWWPAVAATIVLSATWYLAWIAGIEVGHQLLVPLLLLAAVSGALGLAAARSVAFAIGYLYFAIPIWSLINDKLQSLTTRGVGFLIGVTGLPAYIQGNEVHIPSGTFEIAGGCSGIHFFIVALAIATLLGELDRDRLGRRLLLVAIAAAMAIVMNWIRVYGIILNGHLTDMQGFLVTVDHYYYGWALFGVMLLGFFWIARRIAPESAPTDARSNGRGDQADSAIAGRTRAAGQRRAEASSLTLALSITASIAALAAGPALATLVEARQIPASTQALTLPAGQGDWAGPVPADGEWRPVYEGADSETMVDYDHAGASALAYVNRYDWQAQAHEIVGSHNSILGQSGWEVASSRVATAGSGSRAVQYRELTAATPGNTQWVVGYFYSVGGRNFIGDLPSKLYYGVAAARGRPASGVVAAAVRCAADCEPARATLENFLAANSASLASVILKGNTEP